MWADHWFEENWVQNSGIWNKSWHHPILLCSCAAFPVPVRNIGQKRRQKTGMTKKASISNIMCALYNFRLFDCLSSMLWVFLKPTGMLFRCGIYWEVIKSWGFQFHRINRCLKKASDNWIKPYPLPVLTFCSFY